MHADAHSTHGTGHYVCTMMMRDCFHHSRCITYTIATTTTIKALSREDEFRGAKGEEVLQ